MPDRNKKPEMPTPPAECPGIDSVDGEDGF